MIEANYRRMAAGVMTRVTAGGDQDIGGGEFTAHSLDNDSMSVLEARPAVDDLDTRLLEIANVDLREP